MLQSTTKLYHIEWKAWNWDRELWLRRNWPRFEIILGRWSWLGKLWNQQSMCRPEVGTQCQTLMLPMPWKKWWHWHSKFGMPCQIKFCYLAFEKQCQIRISIWHWAFEKTMPKWFGIGNFDNNAKFIMLNQFSILGIRNVVWSTREL